MRSGRRGRLQPAHTPEGQCGPAKAGPYDSPAPTTAGPYDSRPQTAGTRYGASPKAARAAGAIRFAWAAFQFGYFACSSVCTVSATCVRGVALRLQLANARLHRLKILAPGAKHRQVAHRPVTRHDAGWLESLEAVERPQPRADGGVRAGERRERRHDDVAREQHVVALDEDRRVAARVRAAADREDHVRGRHRGRSGAPCRT